MEKGLPADRAGILPGDYIIFVDKHNVVMMPEIDILNLIRYVNFCRYLYSLKLKRLFSCLIYRVITIDASFDKETEQNAKLQML